MNIILEYLLAGLAAIGLTLSAIFAALAALPTWVTVTWTVAVLLAPVAYLLARHALPRLEFPVERLARRERDRG